MHFFFISMSINKPTFAKYTQWERLQNCFWGYSSEIYVLVYYTIGYDFTVCNWKAKSKQVLDSWFIWPCAVERTSHDTHQRNQTRLVCKNVAQMKKWTSEMSTFPPYSWMAACKTMCNKLHAEYINKLQFAIDTSTISFTSSHSWLPVLQIRR